MKSDAFAIVALWLFLLAATFCGSYVSGQIIKEQISQEMHQLRLQQEPAVCKLFGETHP